MWFFVATKMRSTRELAMVYFHYVSIVSLAFSIIRCVISKDLVGFELATIYTYNIRYLSQKWYQSEEYSVSIAWLYSGCVRVCDHFPWCERKAGWFVSCNLHFSIIPMYLNTRLNTKHTLSFPPEIISSLFLLSSSEKRGGNFRGLLSSRIERNWKKKKKNRVSPRNNFMYLLRLIIIVY